MIGLITHQGLWAVVAMVFLAELGIPTFVSPKVALLLVGSASLHSPYGLIGGVICVSLANLVGAIVLHTAARTGGGALMRRLGWERAGAAGYYQRWHQKMGGREAVAIFLGRIMPVVRMYVTVATGLIRVAPRTFVLSAGAAGVVWSGTPLVLGYLMRDNVQRLTAGESTFSRIFLLAVPLAGVVLALGCWIWRANSLRQALRRVRILAGSGAALGIVWYLVNAARANEGAGSHGQASVSASVLVPSMTMLATIVAILGLWALIDLRALHRRALVRVPRYVRDEATGTMTWLAVLGTAGAIMAALELRYPVL